MTKKILVVEDEDFVRLVLIEVLTDEGFDVFSTSNGDDAIRVIDDEGDFDAVVTDIHMPGKADGIAVGRHIRGLLRHISVIYVTGRPDVLTSKLGHLKRREALLSKPYLPSQIIRKLAELGL